MSTSPPPRPDIPKLSSLPLAIDTARLKLRPGAPSDVEDIWPYVSDPSFPRFMTWTAHKDRDEALAVFASHAEELAAGTAVVWVIEHEGRASGMIGLHAIRWHVRAWRVDRAEMGYWLAPRLAGQGLMSEAAQAVLAWGFESLGLHKISVGCIEDNVASRRVIEKLGFRFVGRREDHAWRDGAWMHHLDYELTVTEWSDSSRTQRFKRPIAPR
jgi:ribosomal-protein-alanine N-acetyltransferase